MYIYMYIYIYMYVCPCCLGVSTYYTHLSVLEPQLFIGPD